MHRPERSGQLLVALAAVALTAAVALGNHAVGGVTTVQAADAAVKITEDGYDPVNVIVTAGSVVTWTNMGTTAHTVTSETGDFDSGDLAPGQAFGNQFDTSGTYNYHDAHNPALITGTVVVTAAAPTASGAGTPEPTPPPGTLPPGFGSASVGPDATSTPSATPAPDAGGTSGSTSTVILLFFAVAAVAIALGIYVARRRQPPTA